MEPLPKVPSASTKIFLEKVMELLKKAHIQLFKRVVTEKIAFNQNFWTYVI